MVESWTFLIPLLCFASAYAAVTVVTKSGKVSGRQHTIAGRSVYQFWGIPFAEPPIGKLRFQRPVMIRPWKETLSATTRPNSCTQLKDSVFENYPPASVWNANTEISEDCLYLNIFTTPQILNEKRNAAVLVWIYGGWFLSGTSTLDLYDGSVLSSHNDVIVVTIQYRLNSMGFLYLGIDGAPGNPGMYDMLMAIEWIRENIAEFGGDPNLITLFGESAGGMAVGHLLESPKTHNLFARGILESGTPGSPWSYLHPKDALRNSLAVAKAVGCPHEANNRQAVLDCLLKKDHMEIARHSGFAAPVVDGELVTLRVSANSPNRSVLLGHSRNEGAYFLPYEYTNVFVANKRPLDVENIEKLDHDQFIQIVRDVTKEFNNVVQEAAVFEYTPMPMERVANRSDLIESLDRLFGHKVIIAPTAKYATDLIRVNRPVYYYQFSHVSSQKGWPRWQGAAHADEIPYVFGLPIFDQKYSARERDLSVRMMRYWSTFAKHGVPDGSWPTRTISNRKLFVLDVQPGIAARGPSARDVLFWNQYVPMLGDLTQKLPNRRHVCSSSKSTLTRSPLSGLILASVVYASLF